MEAKVIGDVNQLRFLLENLIDEALAVREEGVIRLQARKDNEYIRFLFTDTRREKSVDELNQVVLSEPGSYDFRRKRGVEGNGISGMQADYS